MSPEAFTFEVIKITLAVTAALFTYFQFFREGRHKQRIEFDVDLRVLGSSESERLVEIHCIAENKGNVEHRFDDIRVAVRGLERAPSFAELTNHEPRVDFPITLHKASLVSKKWQYYFVRPRVCQKFPLVVKVPMHVDFVLVRSTFRYRRSKDIHSCERAFALSSNS